MNSMELKFFFENLNLKAYQTTLEGVCQKNTTGSATLKKITKILFVSVVSEKLHLLIYANIYFVVSDRSHIIIIILFLFFTHKFGIKYVITH